MVLNKSVGNMYKEWITHTWNPLKGKCPHECIYCYVKSIAKRWGKPQGDLRLDKKDVNTQLGSGKKIFVGSSTDMWAECIPHEWIDQILFQCRCFRGNEYLFQTKNPLKFIPYTYKFPSYSILGITLESDIDHSGITKAPWPEIRSLAFMVLRDFCIKERPDMKFMLSIEPVMNFDLEEFFLMIKHLNPDFVSIGADSKKSGLPEPDTEKLIKLIKRLDSITKVRIKKNLFRLLGRDNYDRFQKKKMAEAC